MELVGWKWPTALEEPWDDISRPSFHNMEDEVHTIEYIVVEQVILDMLQREHILKMLLAHTARFITLMVPPTGCQTGCWTGVPYNATATFGES